MVKVVLLSNTKNSYTACYKCLPENKEENSFIIELDFANKELVSHSVEKNSYMIHAISKLYELYNSENIIPIEALSKWY